MARARSDRNLYVGGFLAIAAAMVVIYGVIDAGTTPQTVDTNSPNATTSGPPAAFETPAAQP